MAKTRKKREITLLSATVVGAIVLFAVGLAITLIIAFLPNSDLQYYIGLKFGVDINHHFKPVNVPTSPNNPLMLGYNQYIQDQQNFVVNPISHLAGGLALGFLASLAVPRRRIIVGGVRLSLLVSLVFFLLSWFVQLMGQDWKVLPNNFTSDYVIKQILSLIALSAICSLGAFIARVVKETRAPAKPPETTAKPAASAKA